MEAAMAGVMEAKDRDKLKLGDTRAWGDVFSTHIAVLIQGVAMTTGDL